MTKQINKPRAQTANVKRVNEDAIGDRLADRKTGRIER